MGCTHARVLFLHVHKHIPIATSCLVAYLHYCLLVHMQKYVHSFLLFFFLNMYAALLSFLPLKVVFSGTNMYAVKPWGSVFLIGCSVGTYAMGIGMRWRESSVTIIEKKTSPSYERQANRRCVLTEQTIKLLTDLGCTEGRVRSIVRPSKGWRFLTPQLEVRRESSTFPGCAIGETTFHCEEGALLRMLRTEFLRFGGSVNWETEAYEPFESSDGTDTWSLRKDYGFGTGAEAILTTAANTALTAQLVAPDPGRIAVLFDVQQGVSDVETHDKGALFGDQSDTFILVGDGAALHGWLLDERRCAWRSVRRATTKNAADAEPGEQWDKLVKDMLQRAERKSTQVVALPGTTPAIQDSAYHHRISVLGDGLLPVDPFEWRGDNARCMIEEASTLCRAFYGKKYHRGDVATLLRGVEQDGIVKRANLLRRDLQDAEHFLAVHPLLQPEPSSTVDEAKKLEES
ncbi:hypothetical protein STCU_08036 [Strigomonas culicis]|uniref:FAD-binding domain-containing protein n=1 Tax=Strigomonas culicis TaxID=28005 RepID=S9U1W5_9TRYP|nr:hypothetical protein STCU_08036 [Strigomonas culicis]|eukprot:EPY22923.1 hypothetical protein STCU_08036 [Strigomonas culicis]